MITVVMSEVSVIQGMNLLLGIRKLHDRVLLFHGV
jgi:hypothetical protein